MQCFMSSDENKVGEHTAVPCNAQRHSFNGAKAAGSTSKLFSQLGVQLVAAPGQRPNRAAILPISCKKASRFPCSEAGRDGVKLESVAERSTTRTMCTFSPSIRQASVEALDRDEWQRGEGWHYRTQHRLCLRAPTLSRAHPGVPGNMQVQRPLSPRHR